MNVVYFMGGLGNQMFQYALYKSLESHNKIFGVRANLEWYSEETDRCDFELTKVFSNIRLNYDINGMFEKKKEWYYKIRKNKDWVAFLNFHIPYFCIFFWEKENGVYDKRVCKLKNAAIKGYWQTEKYFKDIREIILKDFTFSYGEERLQILRKKLLEDNKSVAVHVRRGDYLENKTLFGNLSESQYYDNAIKYISQKIPFPHLFFFSNDISWVKEHYNYSNAVYISTDMFEHYEAWYDMCLMSCCSHSIIANSSFSWWGAWLNSKMDKIVIAPKEWLVGKKTPDVWCDNWILM